MRKKRSCGPGGKRGSVLEANENESFMLVGRDCGTLALLSGQDGSSIRVLDGHSDSILAIDVDVDSKRAVTSGADGAVRFWDISQGIGEELLPLGTPSGCIRVIVADWLGAGRALSGSDSGRLCLWGFDSKRCEKVLDVRLGMVISMAVDWTKFRAFVGHGDSGLDLIGLDAGDLLVRLSGHICLVTAISVHWSKARALCGSGDGALVLWDVRRKNPSSFLRGHKSSISAIVVEWALGRAVSASDDNHVRLWSLRSGECFRTLMGHASPVRSLAVDWTAGYAVSGSEGGEILLWNISSMAPPTTLVPERSGAAVGSLALWVVAQEDAEEVPSPLLGRASRDARSFNYSGAW